MEVQPNTVIFAICHRIINSPFKRALAKVGIAESYRFKTDGSFNFGFFYLFCTSTAFSRMILMRAIFLMVMMMMNSNDDE